MDGSSDYLALGDFKSEYREIVEISSKCLEEAHKITIVFFSSE